MIKPEDIRCGNLLYNKFHNDFDVVDHSIIRCIQLELKPDDWQPIELTKDWAVKFGYECLLEMANDFYNESRYHVEIRIDDLKGLKVHEAQNLFYALSGKELTIK